MKAAQNHAWADIDGDGDLDLFVGGRVIPGRWPAAADSLVLKNEGGRLIVYQRLEKAGLVSGAVFSDLDSDGFPELVLACEWGPVKIFRNQRGNLVPLGELVHVGATDPITGRLVDSPTADDPLRQIRTQRTRLR